jgi:hypothetical protein
MLHVSPQTIWKNIFMVPPPIIIKVTQVPPDRYMTGKRARSFPSFSPENIYHIF